MLSRFIQEATDTDEKLFKSDTIYAVVGGLNRSLKESQLLKENPEINLFRSPMFKRLNAVLDGVMKGRQSKEDPRTRKVDVFETDDYNIRPSGTVLLETKTVRGYLGQYCFSR